MNKDNAFGALVHGLMLAVLAPTDAKADDALKVAAHIAALMPAEEVERAKEKAERLLEEVGNE